MNSTIPQNIICRVSKPSQYLGNEIHSIHKDISKMKIRFALVFPDTYEIGMSNQGLKILYNILNRKEYVVTERVYVPGFDYENVLRKENKALCSLESHYPLYKFDIAGFSLQYEMSYTSVLHILSLGRIPFQSSDREKDYPLIIGGGPCAYNPEPLADIFDLFVIGDGEEVILELVDQYINLKTSGLKKNELLYELSKIKGIYVPLFFNPEYHQTGCLKNITPANKDYSCIEKKVFYNINRTDHLLSPIVPYTRTVHDRLTVEIDRGCTQGCRFCQAGYIYRPLRERGHDEIIKLIERSLKNTGYEDVSLSSLNAGMHTDINGLIQAFMDKFEKDNVAVSLPSIRPDTIDINTINEIKKVRKTGFTLAPEAGSQRLRDIINKNLNEDDILHTVFHILSGGWSSFKLYFMIGLPDEKMDDIDAIYILCRKIADMASRKRSLRLKNINIAISSFVPKSHTPFQRVPQASMEELAEAQKLLRLRFKREKNMTLKMHDIKISFIEAVFARGDRRLGSVLKKAYNSGCRLDSWTEYFNFNRWIGAFEECGIDPENYANMEIPSDQILAWEHIKTGISSKFLSDEHKKAVSVKITKDCRLGKCNRCGLGCGSPEIKHKTYENNSALAIEAKIDAKALQRYRVIYEKKGALRFLSHLELINAIYRACRRADIPLKYSQGCHPHPKLSFDAPLPVGIESSSELFDIYLTFYMEPDILMKRLNFQLPEGLNILQIENIPLNSKSITSITKKISYNIKINLHRDMDWEACEHNKYIDSILKNDKIIIKSKNGKPRDINPFIDNIVCLNSSGKAVEINMTLMTDKNGTQISPHKVLKKLYNTDSDVEVYIKKITNW